MDTKLPSAGNRVSLSTTASHPKLSGFARFRAGGRGLGFGIKVLGFWGFGVFGFRGFGFQGFRGFGGCSPKP